MGLKLTERQYSKLKRISGPDVAKRIKTPVKFLEFEFGHDPYAGIVTWDIPIKLDSPNVQMHWRKKNALNKSIQASLKFYILGYMENINLPCTIYLTRIAPRKFDYDNLVFAFKFVRDCIADYLKPGLSRGQADGSDDMEWVYEQESKGKGEYGIRILVIYTK